MIYPKHNFNLVFFYNAALIDKSVRPTLTYHQDIRKDI